jgi:hypothetical protein
MKRRLIKIRIFQVFGNFDSILKAKNFKKVKFFFNKSRDNEENNDKTKKRGYIYTTFNVFLTLN